MSRRAAAAAARPVRRRPPRAAADLPEACTASPFATTRAGPASASRRANDSLHPFSAAGARP